MHRGYIKEYRKIVDWEWYTDVNTSHLFRHCLYKANIEDKKWRGQLVSRGSFITSLEHLSHETGLTVQQVRTALNKLKSTNEITCKTTSHNTVITVNNYETYQENNMQVNIQNNKQITNNQQTNNKQITTTKECKEYNNEKNINKYIKEENKNFEIPTKKELLDYAHNQLGKKVEDIEGFINWYDAQGWVDKNGFPINWKQKLQSWIRNNFKNTPTKEKKNEQKQEEIDYSDYSNYPFI